MSFTEKEQIELAQKNKHEFVRLYDQHFEAIYHFLLARIQKQQLAEDLSSATFMIALEKIDQYRYEGKPFRAWLYRIALNEINQYFRQEKREHRALVREWREQGDHYESADAQVKAEEEESQAKQRMERVQEAWMALDLDQQNILALRYFQDLSYQEIADILELNTNQVGVRLSRALKRLSQLCPHLNHD